MSSVNFSVGFQNERNSSRVLKPPGGGHTDIFGVGKLQEQKKEQEAVKEHENETAEAKEQKVESKAHEEQNQKIREEETVKSKLEPEPSKPLRVPPGGFSSGLW